jgi:peptide/nickel transport system ATP-binding protein
MAHPYSRGLFAARPGLGAGAAARKGRRLATIAGTVPDIVDLPAGCAFAERCPLAIAPCRAALPPEVDLGGGHAARCLRIGDVR